MSKIALSGNASGTGTFTIASPNSNSDRTLTLPDNSGTLLSNASTAGFPAGSVLQVVQGVLTTEVITSTNTFADTGITATITPTNASSKILVFVAITGLYKNTNNTYAYFRLFRNSTNIAEIDRVAGFSGSTLGNAVGQVGLNYLDSPATTAATTYKVQFSSVNNAAAVVINTTDSGIGSISTITLMEIAA